MSVRLSTVTVGQHHRAMVVEFEGDRRIKAPPAAQGVESEFIPYAREHGVQIMLMRITGPRGSFGVEAEASSMSTICEALVRSHIPTYKALSSAGVNAIIHTDVPGDFAEQMRAAGRRVAKALSDDSPGRELEAVVERYLIEDLSFYLSQPFEFVLADVLPPLIERYEPLSRSTA